MRKLVTAAITAAFVAVCLVGGGAGAATAAPIPQVTFTGYNFGGQWAIIRSVAVR